MDGNGTGIIRIERISELFFLMEPVNIYVDGRMVSKVLSGDHKEIAVTPGRHKVFVKAEIVLYGTFSSNTVFVDVEEGGMVGLECGSNYQGIKVVLSKLCMFNKDDTFYIREAHA